MVGKKKTTKSKTKGKEEAMAPKDETPVQSAEITVDGKVNDTGIASEKSSPSNNLMESSGSYSFINSTDGSTRTMTNEEVLSPTSQPMASLTLLKFTTVSKMDF